MAASLRRPAELVVRSLIAILLLLAWHVEWFIVPSGSMAESLLGKHRDVTCGDCGRAFACGTQELPPEGKRAICPNCGYAAQKLDSLPDIDGDRLLVHKAAFSVRAPRRWEVVAFRCPHDAGTVCIKRVVGLPGEEIRIQGGDIFANGVIQRKTLAQQRALALLVHDADFRPTRTAKLPSRWQGEPGTTGWRRSGGRYVHPAPSDRAEVRADGPTDWLAYRHWRRVPGATTEAEEVPIHDAYGYNQTRPVVDSHLVRDLYLSCRLRATGTGTLALFATDGQEQFLVRINPSAGQAQLVHNGTLVAQSAGQLALATGGNRLEMSLVDQQMVLALDGQPVFTYPYVRSDLPFHPTARPLAIGSQGLGAEVWDLQVYRDVYYGAVPGRRPMADGQATYRLGEGEYFVLGDNSPESDDSRFWSAGPAVTAKFLVGKPFLVHLPSRWLVWGRLGFQVPDLPQIRYIR